MTLDELLDDWRYADLVVRSTRLGATRRQAEARAREQQTLERVVALILQRHLPWYHRDDPLPVATDCQTTAPIIL